VRELDNGVSGVVGVRALVFVKDPPDPDTVLTFSDWRRGVLAPVERENDSDEVVRVRVGTVGVSPRVTGGASSEGEAWKACESGALDSVHCRCKMTDLVAHFHKPVNATVLTPWECTHRHLCPMRREPPNQPALSTIQTGRDDDITLTVTYYSPQRQR
jgi:hypothetical protein